MFVRIRHSGWLILYAYAERGKESGALVEEARKEEGTSKSLSSEQARREEMEKRADRRMPPDAGVSVVEYLRPNLGLWDQERFRVNRKPCFIDHGWRWIPGARILVTILFKYSESRDYVLATRL